MTIHLVNAFNDSPTAECCGLYLAGLPGEEITLDPDAVTCAGPGELITDPAEIEQVKAHLQYTEGEYDVPESVGNYS